MSKEDHTPNSPAMFDIRNHRQADLYYEHFRRFTTHPQETVLYVIDLLKGQIEFDDQIMWLLGGIPWFGWRQPFQSSMLLSIRDKFSEEITIKIYSFIDEATSTARGRYSAVPDPQDLQKLLSYIKSHCNKETYDQADNILSQDFIVKPSWLKELFEKCFSSISSLYRREAEIKELRKCQILLSTYFNCKVCLNFLLKINEVLSREGLTDHFDDVVVMACEAITKIRAIMPDFTKISSFKIDYAKEHFSLAIYNFWNWQYTYRNNDYRNAVQFFENFADEVIAYFQAPIVDIHEFKLIAPSLFKNHQDAKSAFLIDYDKKIHDMVKRFGYCPCWPIATYTSEYILPRMISGEFTFWEREIPNSHIDRLTTAIHCFKNTEICENKNKITMLATDGNSEFPICDNKCRIKTLNQLACEYKQIANEHRPRIPSKGHLSRMIGLWIYDYIEEHGVPASQAMSALRQRHFGDDNPNWDNTKAYDAKDGETWYDYKERHTDERLMYLNLEDARYCIAEGKFLAKRQKRSK